MRIHFSQLNGLLKIELEQQSDTRGWFCEGYRKDIFYKAKINDEFVQENYSFTKSEGTIRGLHYQVEPYCQSKLLRCIQGKIFDVVVDLREDSFTYLKWASFVLDGDRFEWLYIPKGFAHGFQTLCDECYIQYLVSEYYHSESERRIRWNDPTLGIEWPISQAILSEKDSRALVIQELNGPNVKL